MTLKERIRAGGVITIALLAVGFVFLGNQRPAYADSTWFSGGSIDNGIFCFLDQFDTTDVFDTGCAPSASTGSLTVTKIVSGTSTPSADFDIHVKSGGTDIANSPQAGDSGGTAYGSLAAGPYTVSETVNTAGTAAGVTLAEFTPSFSGDCDSAGNVTVANNTGKSCTITNTYIPPAVTATTGGLVVKKVVVNTGGGIATPSWFSFTVNSGSATAFNTDGENDIWGMAPGAYSVAEVATSTYTPSYSGCSGTIAAGATSTCTITNMYVPPSVLPAMGGIIVKKVVVNTGGGIATPSWFSFDYGTASATTSNVAWNTNGENDLNVMPGTYSVIEDATSTYTPSYSGECSAVSVTSNATTTCTVTNTYIPPTVTTPPSCTIVSDTATMDTTDSHPAVLVTPLNAAWTATSTVAFDPSAAWIWSENPAINTTVNTTKVFTRTFDIVGTPSSASIDIGADNGFILKVNGTTVVDDSAIENNFSASKHFDITSDLVSGTNTVEVDVTNFAEAGSDGTSNPGGVIFQVNLPDNDCSTSGGGGGIGGTASSDLSLTKTVSTSTPSVGGQVTYTLTATNNGPDAATDASVTDILPAGLTFISTTTPDTIGTYDPTTGIWTIGALADSASASLHIVATVNATDATGTAITNTATITSSNTDSTSGNNKGMATITPIASSTLSDISITKTVDNAAPNVGDTVTYTITASDTGVDATGVVVQDILPSGLTFVSTSTSDVVGNYATSTGNWTIGDLASTSQATLHIMAMVNSDQTNGTVITNMASTTAGDTSSDSANDSASAPITVTIPGSTSGGGGGGGTTAVTTTSGGGGGGNGPIAGSYGGISGGGGSIIPTVPSGQVLGASTSTVTTMPNSCSQYLTAFIGSGKDNDSSQVMRLQTFLNTYEGDSLTINGTYDAATEAATEKFQTAYSTDILTPWGITAPTGFVYLTTRREVNEIYCHFTESFPLTAYQQSIINAARAAVLSASADPSSAGTVGTTGNQEQTAAAIESGMDDVSTATSSSEGTSTSVTNNPFSGIGSFFSKLFGH